MSSIPLTSENIYQYIWNADQAGNGVRPILSPSELTEEDKKKGYVKVDWNVQNNGRDRNHKVLPEAFVPDKDETYKKCNALFDNYNIKDTDGEEETRLEKDEINDFIDAIKDTLPMRIAREYLDPNQTDLEWFDSIKKKWFSIYEAKDSGPSRSNFKARSGFEHVFVGENSGEGNGIGGYHFWYKYILDDKGDIKSNEGDIDSGKEDTIRFLNPDFGSSSRTRFGKDVPEIVTLDFLWDPNEEVETLTKQPRGGFWVGCSPEGLIALGMARWKQKTEGKTLAVINRTRYEMILYTDIDRRVPSNIGRNDDKHINTFWPKFIRSNVDAVAVPDLPKEEDPTLKPRLPGSLPFNNVFIYAARINPPGETEEINERVAIANISRETIDLSNWTLTDGIRTETPLKLFGTIAPRRRRVFDPRANGGLVQLANEGGELRLRDETEKVIDYVKWGPQADGVDTFFI